jgi:putative (di)nucleoside polyphosphate hydrolase
LPQGGINKGESELEALFRELNEEIGLLPKHVDLVDPAGGAWLRVSAFCHW